MYAAARLLLPVFLLYFATGKAQTFERKGNIITYRGNKFEYTPEGKKETQIVTDPVTQKKVKKVVDVDPHPVKMNGAKIYYTEEMSMAPVPDGGDGATEQMILRSLQRELNKLPDGRYYLDLFNIITDTKGRVVYYEYNGLLPQGRKVKVPADVKQAVDKKIDSVVNQIAPFKPGRANSKNVIARTDIFLNFYTITVKKHKASFKKE